MSHTDTAHTTTQALKPNPTLELHTTCLSCSPSATRAICGAHLHGIVMPATPATCPVCPDLTHCPDCGARLRRC